MESSFLFNFLFWQQFTSVIYDSKRVVVTKNLPRVVNYEGRMFIRLATSVEAIIALIGHLWQQVLYPRGADIGPILLTNHLRGN